MLTKEHVEGIYEVAGYAGCQPCDVRVEITLHGPNGCDTWYDVVVRGQAGKRGRRCSWERAASGADLGKALKAAAAAIHTFRRAGLYVPPSRP